MNARSAASSIRIGELTVNKMSSVDEGFHNAGSKTLHPNSQHSTAEEQAMRQFSGRHSLGIAAAMLASLGAGACGAGAEDGESLDSATQALTPR